MFEYKTNKGHYDNLKSFHTGFIIIIYYYNRSDMDINTAEIYYVLVQALGHGY